MSNSTASSEGQGIDTSVRLIAFYLPQFYPFPENDEWWGKGFTEWTNVTKAAPLFPGHYQPHLPTDFGFYDLRVRETRREQIQVARDHGIDGFCYHYYWFSGKRLLNKPIDDMLIDKESDMPFCLCWANENWTRRWDAAEHEILIAQEYKKTDDLDFIKSLIPFFKDDRYIKVDGKPFLIVYRPQHLPDPKKSVAVWREYCREIGIGEIHLSAALTHGNSDYRPFDFDSGVEFPPHNLDCNNISKDLKFFKKFRGGVFSYIDVASFYLKRKYEMGSVFKTVFPDWDNTARVGDRALIILGSTPESYGAWLRHTIEKSASEKPKSLQALVFVNAWNEWAEGCHLEPDRKFGRSYLEATRQAKFGHSTAPPMSTFKLVLPKYSLQSYSSELKSITIKHCAFFTMTIRNRLKRVEVLRKFLSRIRNCRKFMQ